MQAILSAILGNLLLVSAVLAVALLLKRFARLNLLVAILISAATVLPLLIGGFYVWVCFLADQCGF
jgi:hypothetical protein